jgi:hypothetical protein
MELRASDLRRILSVLDDLGRVSDLNGFAARGVAGLHRLVPSRAISFHEIDHRNFGVHPRERKFASTGNSRTWTGDLTIGSEPTSAGTRTRSA